MQSKRQGQMHHKCKANAEGKCVTNAKRMQANARQMPSKCNANASDCKQMKDNCSLNSAKSKKSPATKNSFQNERYASLQRDDGIALKKIMRNEKNIL